MTKRIDIYNSILLEERDKIQTYHENRKAKSKQNKFNSKYSRNY